MKRAFTKESIINCEGLNKKRTHNPLGDLLTWRSLVTLAKDVSMEW